MFVASSKVRAAVVHIAPELYHWSNLAAERSFGGNLNLVRSQHVISDTGHRLFGLYRLGRQFRAGSGRPQRSGGFAQTEQESQTWTLSNGWNCPISKMRSTGIRFVEGMDIVVHLAAIAHRSHADSGDYARANRVATASLAQACGRHKIKRLIFMSSIGAQAGSAADHVVTEARRAVADHCLRSGKARGGKGNSALRRAVYHSEARHRLRPGSQGQYRFDHAPRGATPAASVWRF